MNNAKSSKPGLPPASALIEPRYPTDFPKTIPLTVTRSELGFIPDWKGLSRATLNRRYNDIRDDAGKRPRQPVTLLDVARFLDVPVTWVAQWMKRI